MLLGAPAIAALLLLGGALGMLLAPFAMLYDDVARALGMATFLLFFLTPIVYPPPTSMPGALAVLANPIGLLLVTAREALTLGVVTHATLAVSYGVGAVLLTGLAWVVFRLATPHLVARL
jgi:lipopolysaccharide transport system permease protein